MFNSYSSIRSADSTSDLTYIGILLQEHRSRAPRTYIGHPIPPLPPPPPPAGFVCWFRQRLPNLQLPLRKYAQIVIVRLLGTFTDMLCRCPSTHDQVRERALTMELTGPTLPYISLIPYPRTRLYIGKEYHSLVNGSELNTGSGV